VKPTTRPVGEKSEILRSGLTSDGSESYRVLGHRARKHPLNFSQYLLRAEFLQLAPLGCCRLDNSCWGFRILSNIPGLYSLGISSTPFLQWWNPNFPRHYLKTSENHCYPWSRTELGGKTLKTAEGNFELGTKVFTNIILSLAPCFSQSGKSRGLALLVVWAKQEPEFWHCCAWTCSVMSGVSLLSSPYIYVKGSKDLLLKRSFEP
jgi:hypothetical protein